MDYFWGCHGAKFRPQKNKFNGGNEMDIVKNDEILR
jgi:hypothetical protein